MAVLETRIRESSRSCLSSISSGWSMDSNVALARNIRIVLLWNIAEVDLQVSVVEI